MLNRFKSRKSNLFLTSVLVFSSLIAISGCGSDTEDLESKVSSLESKVRSLESNLSSLESKVRSLESDVSSLKFR